MPRSCSICTHPKRQAIDQALMAGVAFRNIARRFGTSTTAVHQHRHEHLPSPLRPPALLEEISPLEPVLSPEVQLALEAYQEAVVSYEIIRQTDWRRSLYSPGALLSPAWRKVQAHAQRLRQLGFDPASLPS